MTGTFSEKWKEMIDGLEDEESLTERFAEAISTCGTRQARASSTNTQAAQDSY